MYQVPSNTYDAVIVGGGHNGLVAADYLANAGYYVCVLERYNAIGGAAISEEIEGAPGHFASTGSYVLSLMPQKILHELDLFDHGVELIKRNPRSFTPFLAAMMVVLGGAGRHIARSPASRRTTPRPIPATRP